MSSITWLKAQQLFFKVISAEKNPDRLAASMCNDFTQNRLGQGRTKCESFPAEEISGF
jgi:hypothetical protein